MGRRVVLVALFASGVTQAAAQDKWRGFDRVSFEIEGRKCYVVAPRSVALGRPWIWRARFPNYHAEVDVLLLGKGYHVAFIDTNGMLGSPRALRHWDAFYKHVINEFDLAEKVALEAVSRGGLFAYRWAARHPDRIACIYGDTPVCDIRSWPLGRGTGRGHAATWRVLLREYGMTHTEALAFRGNPIDVLQPIAAARIPILHIVSENDEIVPPNENTYVLRDRYRKLGGSMAVISITEGTAKSKGHHFPLAEPEKGVEFIVRHTHGEYFTLRRGLDNCRLRFAREKNGRVAFLGGSITHNPGWRPMVCDYLKKRFPDTGFDFISAGIPSMGSTPGAFRMARDVLSRGRVDLLFAEAAVNDSTNGRTAVEQVRGMEGIVRHARRINPGIDIVMLHFVDPAKMKAYRTDRVPEVIVSHERVAVRYGVASIDLAREVTERIDAGEFTWRGDFKNLHPSPFGQRVYFRSIVRLFDAAWRTPLAANARSRAHPMPGRLDPSSYDRGRLVDIRKAELGEGWTLVPRWRPMGRESTRPGFVDVPMLVATVPGAELKWKFRGRAAGIFVAAGPDAGMVEFSVDGAPFRTQDLYTRWSGRLHLPWLYVLAAGLSDEAHELTLRVGAAKHAKSRGTAVRIVHFAAN